MSRTEAGRLEGLCVTLSSRAVGGPAAFLTQGVRAVQKQLRASRPDRLGQLCPTAQGYFSFRRAVRLAQARHPGGQPDSFRWRAFLAPTSPSGAAVAPLTRQALEEAGNT